MKVSDETIKAAWYADVNASEYGATHWTDRDLQRHEVRPEADMPDGETVYVKINYDDGYGALFEYGNARECLLEATAYAKHCSVRQVLIWHSECPDAPVAVSDANGDIQWIAG